MLQLFLNGFRRTSFTFLFMLGVGMVMHAQQKLPAKQFRKKLQETPGSLLLDVRTPKEISRSYIKTAVFLDFHDTAFKKMLTRLNPEKPVFVYCAIGVRSHDAAIMLQELGFKEVYDLKGGIINWKLAGLPVVKGKDFDPRTGMSKTEFLESIKDRPLVLVDFYAPWCAPCQVMVPALDSMKKTMGDTASIITINADENLRLMKELKFYSLPYIMVFKKGNLVFEQEGFMSRKDMEALIRKFAAD
jgi:thioredoxin 1